MKIDQSLTPQEQLEQLRLSKARLEGALQQYQEGWEGGTTVEYEHYAGTCVAMEDEIVAMEHQMIDIENKYAF